MKAEILDPLIYKKAKEIADNVYDRPSAYKSGYIVKIYKELGGRYSSKTQKNKTDLKRWFAEEWKDVNPLKTNNSYPVYRPTKKISKKTPLTVNEIDKKNLMEQSKLKQLYKYKKNLPPFKNK